MFCWTLHRLVEFCSLLLLLGVRIIVSTSRKPHWVLKNNLLNFQGAMSNGNKTINRGSYCLGFVEKSMLRFLRKYIFLYPSGSKTVLFGFTDFYQIWQICGMWADFVHVFRVFLLDKRLT